MPETREIAELVPDDQVINILSVASLSIRS